MVELVGMRWCRRQPQPELALRSPRQIEHYHALGGAIVHVTVPFSTCASDVEASASRTLASFWFRSVSNSTWVSATAVLAFGRQFQFDRGFAGLMPR
jgi:hypothetical protein